MSNIYLLTRTDHWSYDEYDSLLVVAANEEDALEITPDGHPIGHEYTSWVYSKSDIEVMLVGTATMEHKEGSIVISSFNAG